MPETATSFECRSRHVRGGLRCARTLLVAFTVGATSFAADRPWQQLTNPTAAEVAKQFATPPPEYAAAVTWGWNGPMTEEAITRDLDALHARGLRVATIEAGYRMDNAPYLSDGWFKLIRFAAEEARKRGMRLWIIDEGKYPSGFANGKFSRERPELRMQGIAVADRVAVAAGQSITRDVAAEVVGVIALDLESGANRLLEVAAGKVNFTVPPGGKWQLVIVDHQFRTGDTRAVSDPSGAKTTKNHMGDLLNPIAVRQWMEWTHEGYQKHVGDLFGSAILGFRGDEPDFAYTPWNAGIVDEFQRRKGYDPRPYLAYFASFPRTRSPAQTGGTGAGRSGQRPAAANQGESPPARSAAAAPALTDEQRRAKADYWDVWSDLFAENFFKQQADWCAAHGVEYMTHLNQDHDLALNVRLSGDFFKAMRPVQIPGIDVIWSQIYPGRGPADFPKFASSAAHVYGHPRALSESFAAFYDPVTVEVARWVVNQQMVRGISLFEFMFYISSAGRTAATAAAIAPDPSQSGVAGAVARTQNRGRRYLDEPEFPALAEYVNRCQFLLSQGRPAAQIGVYMPIPDFWLGDQSANVSTMKIAQQLLEAQRDFDFVDDRALATAMQLARGEFTNLSGQSYRAIIVPSVMAMAKTSLERLEVFARAGGKVFFLGRAPSLAVERTFLRAGAPPDPGWATLREKSDEVTPAVLAALPPADVAFDAVCPAVKYSHRRLRDAEVYFFFNESDRPQARQASLAGAGTVEWWDARTGRREALADGGKTGDTTRLALSLGRYEAKIVVIRATPPAVAGIE